MKRKNENNNKNNLDAAKLLIDYITAFEAKSKNGFTALINAINQNNIVIVKLLLDHGTNIEAKDMYGITPLIRAIHTININMVRLLLDHGANIEAKDGLNNVTPLMFAVDTKSIDIIELLLDRGADIKFKNGDGNTALVCAVENAQNIYTADIVKLLLDRGVDVEAKTTDGETALTLAALDENIVIVKLLLIHGAKVDISMHALRKMYFNNKFDLGKHLAQSGIESTEELAEYERDFYKMKYLLNGAASIQKATSCDFDITDKTSADFYPFLISNEAREVFKAMLINQINKIDDLLVIVKIHTNLMESKDLISQSIKDLIFQSGDFEDQDIDSITQLNTLFEDIQNLEKIEALEEVLGKYNDKTSFVPKLSFLALANVRFEKIEEKCVWAKDKIELALKYNLIPANLIEEARSAIERMNAADIEVKTVITVDPPKELHEDTIVLGAVTDDPGSA